MEINYIILAHKNPEQLKRLIVKLSTTWTYFYIHIDSGVNLEPFQEALFGAKNVYFLTNNEREEGIWGDSGLVKATINVLKKLVSHNRKGYCILLSGQDYPLRKNMDIQRFFFENQERHFITAFSLPHPQLDKGGLPRINRYKINKSGKRGHFLFLPSIFETEFYNLKTVGKLNFLRKNKKWKDLLQVFKKRKYPKYLKPYAGSQWWALSVSTIEKILSFVEKYPDYLEYHYYSLIPDEMFFQSILISIEKTDNSGISKSVTYVNWERPSGPLPVTFKKEDIKELKEASKDHLFARKFDIKQDREILNLIDNKLLL